MRRREREHPLPFLSAATLTHACPRSDSIIKGVHEGGWKPRYVIVELNVKWSQKVFEDLGYISIGRFNYDEVFWLAGE